MSRDSVFMHGGSKSFPSLLYHARDKEKYATARTIVSGQYLWLLATSEFIDLT